MQSTESAFPDRTGIDLQRAKDRLQLLIDSVDGVVWEADAETFRFLFVSKKAERLFGYPVESWYQPDFWVSILHPEDRGEAVRFCAERTRRMEAHELEYRVLAKDGRVLWVHDIVSVLSTDGRPATLQGIMVDITARKRIEMETERLLRSEQAARAALERAGEALRASEEKLRLAQDAADMGSWDWNVISGELVWSDRCKAMFGLPPDTHMTYEVFLGAVDPGDRGRVDRAVRDALASRTEYRAEMRVTVGDGSVRWIASKGRALYDPAGHAVRMLGMMLDVTDLKRGEEALREQLSLEDRLSKVASSVPGVVCSFRLRADGSASMPISTPAIQDVFGHSQEELANDWTPLAANLFPEDAQRVQEEIWRSARTLSPFHSEFRYLHPARGLRWIEVRSVPKAEPGGDILWHGFAMDVTDRKRSEQALRERETLYRSLFTLAPSGVVLVQSDGHLIAFNDQAHQQLGYSRWEFSRLTMSDLNVGESPEDFRRHFGWTVEKGGAELEVRQRAKGGDVRVVLVRSRPIQMEGQTRLLSVWQDITERKRAQEMISESDRRKGEFLAMLSHELRNPLAPIRNSLYLLERVPAGSEEATESLRVIARQTEHLTRLVDDLLDLTRISRGKIELSRERMDLREVVRRTFDDHRSLFSERLIETSLILPDGPIWVDVDATRMAQVLGNLLQNAAKFTLERGSVAVQVAVDAGRAQLQIRDDGLGIGSQLLEHLFEPFVQGERGLARTQGGLGLGLALVKGITVLHGGTVSAKSGGMGHGSEFIVEIPLVPEPQAKSAERAAEEHPAHRRIVVVEDNSDAGQTLTKVLELEGHRVQLATNGTSGIRMVREVKPDVVLCDIGLPDMDGYDVARTLRADEALRTMRLIAVTGYAQPEDRQRAKEAGFDAQLEKPVRLDKLAELIASGRP